MNETSSHFRIAIPASSADGTRRGPVMESTVQYIVEMALKPGHTDEDWAQWDRDMKPASLLMTVPGFLSAQRFKGVSEPLAYYAIYEITGGGVLTSDAYRNVGGGVRVKKWNSHNIAYWRRDLVDGPVVPPVPEGYMLVVKTSSSPDFPDQGVPFTRLKTVDLDHSVAYRGIAVVPAAEAMRLVGKNPDILVYKPIAPQLTAKAA